MELFKLNELRQYQFIQVPKELLYSPRYKNLSSDSKLIYGLLLDRMELSRDNGWINEDEEIYLIFTRESIEKILSISHSTCVKAFSQLAGAKLIRELRQGLGKPNLIYIGHIIYDNAQSIENTQTFKNYTSRCKLNKPQEIQNLNTNKTNTNKTNVNLQEEEITQVMEVDKEVIKIYMDCITKRISNVELKMLLNLQKLAGKELLNKAIILATMKNGKNLGYIQSILEDWDEKGFKTLEQVNLYLTKWVTMNRKAKENRTKQINRRAENKYYGQKEGTFNNFEQRKYDGSDGGMTLNELEEKLLKVER